MADSSDDMPSTGRGTPQDGIEELEKHLVGISDDLFGLAAVLCRVIVDAGLITKDDLAAMILERAGREDDPDHRPTLAVFSRAIRMNLPGGRFDVIEGGRTCADPPTS